MVSVPRVQRMRTSMSTVMLSNRYGLDTAQRTQVKVVGAGHSFSGIQLTDGTDDAPSGLMVSLDR